MVSVSTLVDGVVGAVIDGSRSRSGARLRATLRISPIVIAETAAS